MSGLSVKNQGQGAKITYLYFITVCVSVWVWVCVCVCVCARACSVAPVMSDSATPWTVVLQAPLSMRFPGQEYQSGLLFPSSRDVSDPVIELVSSAPPALVGGLFTTVITWRHV